VLELTGIARPSSTLEAKLSVYHAAAAAIVLGGATLQAFAPAAIAHPAVLALRERVTVTPDPAIQEDEARIAIELADGRTLERHIDHAVGSVSRPMSDADMRAKFRGLAEPVLAKPQVDELIRACDELERLPDAAVLGRLAAPAADAVR
jgi:2-methylcitrate dehydratase PrpD